ncbi:MAG: 4-vinyl reductase [Oscillospiraceae bacterium]|jgi:predicted hydrocarbon binding protein|nr:4-vinyl reductase [Oscillospiraceae bacterium]
MRNVFENNSPHAHFSWDNLGDIAGGRGDLGEEMPVLVYRLMQYTMLDVLSQALGLEKANEFFRAAGHLAGTEFAKNSLDLRLDFDGFFSVFQKSLKEMKIGILRMESFDADTGTILLTIGQDLDCSGLPVTYENVCVYDEGFLSGVLEVYTGQKYAVREVDCWASGDRVCRFEAVVAESPPA